MSKSEIRNGNSPSDFEFRILDLRSHFGQSEIQAAEVMPGAVFGELIDSLLKKSTSIGSLIEKQTSHAAIEKNRNVFLLRLPRRKSLLGLATMPGKGGPFVSPGGTPFRRHVGLIRDYLVGSIKILGQTKDGHGQQASREFFAARRLARPLDQLGGIERTSIRYDGRLKT